MVSYDDTRGITLGTKLKKPIFTLHLPHNLQSRFLYFKSLYNKDKISNKAYQNVWDNQEVNTQIDKDLNP